MCIHLIYQYEITLVAFNAFHIRPSHMFLFVEVRPHFYHFQSLTLPDRADTQVTPFDLKVPFSQVSISGKIGIAHGSLDKTGVMLYLPYS